MKKPSWLAWRRSVLTTLPSRLSSRSFFPPSTARLSVQVPEAQVRWDKERVESDRLKQENLQIESHYQDLQRQLAAARSEAPTQAVSPPRSALRPPTP